MELASNNRAGWVQGKNHPTLTPPLQCRFYWQRIVDGNISMSQQLILLIYVRLRHNLSYVWRTVYVCMTTPPSGEGSKRVLHMGGSKSSLCDFFL